ncbi:MAG: fluoride efflux transporter CrcB [Ferruginibacter sp.]
MLKNLLLVGAGGALGAMARYFLFTLLKNSHFPFATLVINITGSFGIGLLFALSMKQHFLPASAMLFLATGICGGFTTFSAFSLENLELMQNGKLLLSFIYIAASVLLGLGACWLGFKIFQA